MNLCGEVAGRQVRAYDNAIYNGGHDRTEAGYNAWRDVGLPVRQSVIDWMLVYAEIRDLGTESDR